MKTIEELDVRLIDQGENVRTRLEVGEAIVASIKRHGIIQPITVSTVGAERYEVLYGHRRLAGAKLAGLTRIPAIVERAPRDLGMRQLAENLDRRRLSHMDIALALRAELDATQGLTQTALARSLGRHPTWVNNMLALLRMAPELQDGVRNGHIRSDEALKLRPRTGVLGRPRAEIALAVEQGRSASVVIPLRGGGKVTIGVDREEATIDLVVADGKGHTTMVLLDAREARLIARRLTQANEAISS